MELVISMPLSIFPSTYLSIYVPHLYLSLLPQVVLSLSVTPMPFLLFFPIPLLTFTPFRLSNLRTMKHDSLHYISTDKSELKFSPTNSSSKIKRVYSQLRDQGWRGYGWEAKRSAVVKHKVKKEQKSKSRAALSIQDAVFQQTGGKEQMV